MKKAGTIEEYEFGIEKFQNYRKDAKYHIIRQLAFERIESIVSDRPEGVSKVDVLYNLQEYYYTRKFVNSYNDKFVMAVCIPLELALVAFMLSVDLGAIASIIVFLMLAILLMWRSAKDILIPEMQEERYYDYYYRIICEYIKRERS